MGLTERCASRSSSTRRGRVRVDEGPRTLTLLEVRDVLVEAKIGTGESEAVTHRLMIVINGRYVYVTVDGVPRLREEVPSHARSTGILVLGIAQAGRPPTYIGEIPEVRLSNLRVWEP